MTAVATDRRRRRGRRAPLHLAALVAALLGCGDDPTRPPPACEDAPSLLPGDPVSGELTVDDPRRAGAPVDYYAINVEATTLTVTMTSDWLDPFLYLFRADGTTLAQAFHPVGDPETESVSLRQEVGAGCYLVGASGWSRDARGPYTLTAEVGPPSG